MSSMLRVGFVGVLLSTTVAGQGRSTTSGSAAVASGSCEALTSFRLTNARVTSAKSAEGVCRVAATRTPSADSDIKVEVWLPESGWNGKLQSVGNGGWAG